MKVKCVKILSPATGKDLGSKSSWLTVGKVYVVLALTLESEEISRVLLESDDSSPKDFYINQFEVIDDYLPENWETKNGEDFIVWKAPKAWLEEGFWQRFDNAEEESLRVYLEERNKMM